MQEIDYLIVGGGIAGTTAAETIRSRDSNSSIVIITEEADRLYSRVLLPRFLRNENTFGSLYIRQEKDYREKNITLFTNERVLKVDTENKQISTDKKRSFSYKKLLVATGGKVNKLDIPDADLPGVVYMRTLEDIKRIKDLISKSKEAVVLGGGFIGIEFAQSFIKNGLKTASIIREKTFWDTIVGENSGKLLSQILTENGVKILAESQVSEFIGNEKLEGVKLLSGQSIVADIAGVGIGIHLDIDYLKDSGLSIKKGVVTNEYLETSVSGVWAAGDIAEFYDPIFQKYHTMGNWSNASAQGRTVGINMTGEKSVFETTSTYSINIFGINFSFLGDPSVDENTEIIERGSLADKKLVRLLIRNGLIVGASVINNPSDRNAIGQLIKNRKKIASSKTKLGDLEFDLSTI